MSDDKHLKVVKTKTIHEEFQEDMFQELIEAILPKVKPAIKPAVARFTEYMKGGRKILMTIVEGKVHLFVIKDDDIDSFSLKEGSEPEHTYDVETFIQMILSGQFK